LFAAHEGKYGVRRIGRGGAAVNLHRPGDADVPRADYDAGLLAASLGEIPVAGFFCDGKLGPVGENNFLHTFTASIPLFPALVT
jgi:hypothetical protein